MASSVDFERIFISSHLCGCAGIQRGRKRESQGHLQWSISQKLHYHFKAGLCWRRPKCDTGALWMMKHGSEIGVESLLPLSAFPNCPSIIPPAPFTVPHFLSVIYVVLPFLSRPFPPRLLLPPCVLSVSLTPGCLDGKPDMSSLFLFLFPPD